MALTFPHTVTVTSPGRSPDRYNAQNTTKTWTVPPATETVTRGWFQPFAGSEDESGGNVQVYDGVIFLPASTVIDGDDRVTVLGATWDVVGPPEVWSTGSALDHMRVRLRRVTG